MASNSCLRNIWGMFSSILICSVLSCLCTVFVQVVLLPCLGFDEYLNVSSFIAQLLPSISSRLLLQSVGMTTVDNEVLITRVTAVGNVDLSELLSLGGFCPLVFCTCSFRNTLLRVPFWQKGCPFACCLNLGHEELSGLLLCKFSPSRCCLRNKAKLRKEKKSQSRGYLNI